MESLVIFIVIAVINIIIWAVVCQKVAEGKGYNGVTWQWWGGLFGIFALIVLLTKPNLNAVSAAASSTELNNIRAVQEYKNLLDAGVITQAEFDRKRAELLHISPTAAAAAPSPAGDKFEQVKQFKSLLDAGAITQEEFERKKAELLK